MSIVNSEYSAKTRISTASVYQTNGKPLSAEALYKAKLKYGIFNSPSHTGLGVPDGAGASDTAALLAASTDLTVKPYKRTLAADAQTAALLARKDSSPEIWKRENVDFNAQSAASSAKPFADAVLKKKQTDFSHLPTSASSINRADSIKSSSNAASAAGRAKATSLASSNLASLYEFDAVRAHGTNTHLNLSKITSVSKDRAQTLVNDRLNPEKNASVFGLKTQSKQDSKTLEAFAAVGALASQGYTVPEDPDLEAKNVYRNSLIDPKVLATASLNASKTLKGIDKNLGERDLLLNPEFNKAALAIAQRHYEDRTLGPNVGKVDIGGGLFMTQAELDAIAAKFVNPVLESINNQAEAQRKKDAEIAKEKETQRIAYENFKKEQKAKKLEDKRLKEEAKIQRRKDLEAEKQREIKAKQDLESTKKEELAKTQEILASKKEEEARRREELLSKKNAETERISQEAKDAEERRASELQQVHDDHAAKLEPILAELAKEEEKLALLESEKKAIEEITNSQIQNTENAQTLLDASKTELEQAEKTLENLKLDIENSKDETEKLLKESELKKAEAEIVLKKTAEVEAEANLKRAEIEKERSEIENERLKLELELEHEKISALEDEKKIIDVLAPTVEAEKAEAEEKTKLKLKAEADEKLKKQSTSLDTAGPKPITSSTSTSNTSSDPQVNENGRYKSLVDEALYYKPTSTSAQKVKTVGEEKATDGGELKQTFSGFSQGSGDEKAVNTEKSAYGLFKEEF